MEKINQNDIRNVMLPLAVGKPNLYKKIGLVGILTFYIMLVLNFFFFDFLKVNTLISMGLIYFFLFLFSFLYDYFYRSTLENIIDDSNTCAVIGFSNKLIILSGEDVINEFEADEIKIRKVNAQEIASFFPKYTSIIECLKDGKVMSVIGVDRLLGYEDIVLKADYSRVDEDLEIVYDDDSDK